MKTYTLKTFKYKDKTFKFKQPLKVVIDNFLCHDLKTFKGELSIPCICDGYTGDEIKYPTKEIHNYITYVFDNYLTKKDEDLSDSDKKYKESFMNLFDLTKTK